MTAFLTICDTSACCPLATDVAKFLGLYGTDLQVGLLGAAYAAVGIAVLAALWNGVMNLRRRRLLRPTRTHGSFKLANWTARLTVGAQGALLLAMVVVTAAQYTMVIDDFLSRYFNVPETTEGILWQYKVFIGLFAFLLIAEGIRFVTKRRRKKAEAARAAEWDERANRAIERALAKGDR